MAGSSLIQTFFQESLAAGGIKIGLWVKPTLDFSRKQEILPYLDRLHKNLDIPILYVSHSSDEVARLADHLVVMERGRILASGPLTDMLARNDLPLQLGEDVGVVLDAVLTERDECWHLAKVDFACGHIWVQDCGLAIGRKVRLRILAKDVSLALTNIRNSSLQNSLLGTVLSMAEDKHPAFLLARVSVGSIVIIVQLTKQSVAMLELTLGQSVWVQVKTTALLA